jgi:His/Glu/Gln/Arg/opine family amino acid ABC transporter permease subunit
MEYTFHFGVVLDNANGFIHGIQITLLLSVTSIVGAAVLGLIAALGRLSSIRPLSWIAGAYIEFLRNTPLVVQLVWIYYCMPIILGINLPRIPAAILGLSIGESANIAEIIRAGLQAVAPGQIEAAQASGFSHMRTMRHVVLPQALRLMIPPFLNSYVSLLKATALVAIIAVPDLMFTAQRMAADTYRPIELLTTAAILYFLITYPVVLGVRVLERRVRLVPAR